MNTITIFHSQYVSKFSSTVFRFYRNFWTLFEASVGVLIVYETTVVPAIAETGPSVSHSRGRSGEQFTPGQTVRLLVTMGGRVGRPNWPVDCPFGAHATNLKAQTHKTKQYFDSHAQTQNFSLQKSSQFGMCSTVSINLARSPRSWNLLNIKPDLCSQIFKKRKLNWHGLQGQIWPHSFRILSMSFVHSSLIRNTTSSEVS